MSALETKIGELAAWRVSDVQLSTAMGTHRPSLHLGGNMTPVVNIRGGAGVYTYPGEMEKEPEFQAAWAKVQEAVQGLHAAREAIIQRKALELANLIHGDKLNGIRALVDQIQGGAEQ